MFSRRRCCAPFPGYGVCSPGKRSATGEDIPRTAKNPAPSGTGFFLFDAGSLWRASCPPPSGPLLRNVQIRSRRICPAPESAHRQTTDKTKGPVFRLSLSFYLMPGSSLLSHGETPHYHRRYGVSLLSSAWGQVGPPRYRRQANSVLPARHMTHWLICITLKIISNRQNSFGVVRLSLTVH